jgi:hemoglobin/transferrin/lactoferrin receptor protein
MRSASTLQDDMRFGKLNVLAGLRHDTVKGAPPR